MHVKIMMIIFYVLKIDTKIFKLNRKKKNQKVSHLLNQINSEYKFL